MSARSKRTAERKASPTTSTSSTGTTSTKKGTPSTGAGTARASRTATRAPSPSKPTAKKSTPSTGQAGARTSRTATRAPSPVTSPKPTVKDTTVSSSADTVQTETIVTAPIETIPEVVYVEPPIEEVFLPPTYPEAGTISFEDITENSVIVYWKPKDDGGSPITGYHLVIKNVDTGYTKFDIDQVVEGGMLASTLDSGTNYRVYLIVINAVGNSPESSNDFKTLGVKEVQITISPEVQAILTKLGNNDYTYPSWFNNNIKWVNDGTITSNEFLIAFNNLLQNGTIIDKTAPPIEDTTISENMVSQTIEAFKLENGNLTGDITYIAESSFNPFYYGENKLISFVKVYDKSGNLIPIDYNKEEGKDNKLYFTNTERDERISIDEKVGDIEGVKIEFYVWNNEIDRIQFSPMKKTSLLCVDCAPPCIIGQHRDFSGKCVPDDPKEVTTSLLGKFLGVTALIGTLALLGSKGR